MRHYALYDHRWTKIHRPESVPGLLLELQPHLVHSVSSNPVGEAPCRAPARKGRLDRMVRPG